MEHQTFSFLRERTKILVREKTCGCVRCRNAELHNTTLSFFLSHHTKTTAVTAWLSFNVKQFYTNIRNSSHIVKFHTNTCPPQSSNCCETQTCGLDVANTSQTFPLILPNETKVFWGILSHTEKSNLNSILNNGDEMNFSITLRLCVYSSWCGFSMTVVHLWYCVVSCSWQQMF